MTKRKIWIIPLLLAACLLLGMLFPKPLYYAYRELEYRFSEPTAAEQIVHDYAKKNRVPYGAYPEDLIQLLEDNTEAADFVLAYPFRQEAKAAVTYSRETVPHFLQWDPNWGYEIYGSSYLAVTGCGPTCLAMVGYYLTGNEEMLPHRVAQFAEENGYYEPGYGSSWTLISEGSQALGLYAQELPLVKSKMVEELEAGNPIILALDEGDFTTTGHYIVLTGVENDAFRVNDPNSIVLSQRLWTYEQLEGQIRNIWALSVGS